MNDSKRVLHSIRREDRLLDFHGFSGRADDIGPADPGIHPTRVARSSAVTTKRTSQPRPRASSSRRSVGRHPDRAARGCGRFLLDQFEVLSLPEGRRFSCAAIAIPLPAVAFRSAVFFSAIRTAPSATHCRKRRSGRSVVAPRTERTDVFKQGGGHLGRNRGLPATERKRAAGLAARLAGTHESGGGRAPRNFQADGRPSKNRRAQEAFGALARGARGLLRAGGTSSCQLRRTRR